MIEEQTLHYSSQSNDHKERIIQSACKTIRQFLHTYSRLNSIHICMPWIFTWYSPNMSIISSTDLSTTSSTRHYHRTDLAMHAFGNHIYHDAVARTHLRKLKYELRFPPISISIAFGKYLHIRLMRIIGNRYRFHKESESNRKICHSRHNWSHRQWKLHCSREWNTLSQNGIYFYSVETRNIVHDRCAKSGPSTCCHRAWICITSALSLNDEPWSLTEDRVAHRCVQIVTASAWS
jgi:hypothetical protein